MTMREQTLGFGRLWCISSGGRDMGVLPLEIGGELMGMMEEMMVGHCLWDKGTRRGRVELESGRGMD